MNTKPQNVSPSDDDSKSMPKPRIELHLNWLDQWNMQWSCNEDTWKVFSKTLKSPISKGLATIMGISIGIGVASYGYIQVKDDSPHSLPVYPEAPMKK